MNKEIKDRLEKLENELKESKDEIHSLKSAVSLKIERGIGKLLSRFTRKQIILGSLIVLFSISIIGIAGTVTKTYTFSSGDVVSASKINTNFDTLYTLVNGNLDGANMSIDPDSMVLFTTPMNITGNMGWISGADALCTLHHDSERTSIITNSCSNVRAVIAEPPSFPFINTSWSLAPGPIVTAPEEVDIVTAASPVVILSAAGVAAVAV